MPHASKKKLKSIEVRRAKNGITVRHEHQPRKSSSKNGPSDPYEPADEYAFNDHGAASAHVSAHLAQMFDGGDDEAPGDDEQEPDADDKKPAKKADRPADAKANVAAFHRLRKKGHLK